MIGRIVRPADFQRVLAAPLRSRSPHFAVHFLAGRPGSPGRPVVSGDATEGAVSAELACAIEPQLSTALSTETANPASAAAGDVDDAGRWLGLVVPKRHARRAVTRNLIKRQVRALMGELAPQLPAGLWVVRLRAGFDRQAYLSPASDTLRADARAELAALLERAISQPLPPRPPGERPARPRRR